MSELGECDCLDSFNKEQLIELVDDAIRFESDVLDELEPNTKKFNYVLEERDAHKELLSTLRHTPECK